MTNSYTLGRGYNYDNGTPAHPNKFERGWGRVGFDSTAQLHSSSCLVFASLGPTGQVAPRGCDRQGVG